MSDKTRSFKKYAGEFVLFLLIFFGVMWWQTRALVGSGEAAPKFDLVSTEGARISTESLKSKPTLLYFWAPWCGVCKANAHNVQDVKSRWGEQLNVVSVGLSYKNTQEVLDFASGHGMPHPVVFGEDSTGRDYRINAFPTVYILDKEGRVSGSVVGYTTEIGLHLRVLWARFF